MSCPVLDTTANVANRTFEVTVTCSRRVPGDCNEDDSLDIADGVCLLGHLFLGEPAALPCSAAGTTNPGGRTLMNWNGPELERRRRPRPL